MTGLVEVVRSVVRHELDGLRTGSLGVVTAVHPHAAEDDDANDEVDVRLKHEGLELPQVPVAVTHPGAAMPLKVGDLVLVQFVEGDLQQALVTACFHHGDDRPPLHAAGDLVVEHRASDGTRDQLRFAADGGFRLDRDAEPDGSSAVSSLEVTAEGDVTVRCGDDITLALKKSDGSVALTCSALTVTGDVVVASGGNLTVKGGTAAFSDGSTTTEISGNGITGKMGGT